MACVFFGCQKSAVKKETTTQKQDSTTLKLLKKTYKVLKSKDSVQFLTLNEKADLLTRANNDTIGMAEVSWNYGSYYYTQNVIDKSFFYYNKSYKYYSKVGKTYYAAKMLYNMAIIKERIKDYTGSEILVIKALKDFKTLKRHKNSYKCYNLLGVLNNEIEDYDKSVYYFELALDFLKKTSNKISLLESTYNNLGLAYKGKKDFKKAIFYFTEALKYEDLQSNNLSLYAKLIDNLEHTKLLNKSLETDSYTALVNAKTIRDTLSDFMGLTVSYDHISDYYLSQKDTLKAVGQLNKALKLSEEINYNKYRLNSLKKLAVIEPKKSSNYLNRYVSLSDSLQDEERRIRNKFTRIGFETDEFFLEKERLNRHNNRLVIGLLVASLMFMMFVYILYQRNKNKQLHFDAEQQIANEKIYGLLLKQRSDLEKGRQQERDRISEELHDGVLGRLFGTRLSLGFLKSNFPDEQQDDYGDLIDSLHSIEKEIRVISHDLKNDIISAQFTFVSVLNNLFDEQKNVANYHINFTMDDTISWEEIPNVIKINFYRIIQEALMNINKYANATQVDIVFVNNTDAKTISLTIKDNGVGFDVKSVKKGIGQINMASRVKKLNGLFNLVSDINKGTIINVAIPINR